MIDHFTLYKTRPTYLPIKKKENKCVTTRIKEGIPSFLRRKMIILESSVGKRVDKDKRITFSTLYSSETKNMDSHYEVDS